jgi:hypothetical protein
MGVSIIGALFMLLYLAIIVFLIYFLVKVLHFMEDITKLYKERNETMKDLVREKEHKDNN